MIFYERACRPRLCMRAYFRPGGGCIKDCRDDLIEEYRHLDRHFPEGSWPILTSCADREPRCFNAA